MSTPIGFTLAEEDEHFVDDSHRFNIYIVPETVHELIPQCSHCNSWAETEQYEPIETEKDGKVLLDADLVMCSDCEQFMLVVRYPQLPLKGAVMTEWSVPPTHFKF